MWRFGRSCGLTWRRALFCKGIDGVMDGLIEWSSKKMICDDRFQCSGMSVR